MEAVDNHKSESDLLSEIRNGNHNLYRVLVDRYSSMVFHIVRKFEKDDDEVEELAQQIFVKAFEKLSGFKEDSKFSTWLYSLAFNHCRDYAKNIRRQNKRFSEMGNDFLNTNISDELTPYLNLERKEWSRLLKGAIEKLSTSYTQPFLMKYRDGMSYESMSEETGVSISALKVRVHRARNELKSILNKHI